MAINQNYYLLIQIHSIECDDVYKDMNDNKHLFDMSEYCNDNPIDDTTNKKVTGKF